MHWGRRVILLGDQIDCQDAGFNPDRLGHLLLHSGEVCCNCAEFDLQLRNQDNDPGLRLRCGRLALSRNVLGHDKTIGGAEPIAPFRLYSISM